MHDDDAQELLSICEENGSFCSPSLSFYPQPLPFFTSHIQVVLFSIFDFFGNNQFIRFQSQGFQGFPSHVLSNAYDDEKLA